MVVKLNTSIFLASIFLSFIPTRSRCKYFTRTKALEAALGARSRFPLEDVASLYVDYIFFAS